VGRLLGLLLLSLRPRRFLSAVSHPCIIFRRAAPRRCICRQATYRVRYKIADMLLLEDGSDRAARQRNADWIALATRFISGLCRRIVARGGQRAKSLPPASPQDRLLRRPL
jgi:hypothetical protein